MVKVISVCQTISGPLMSVNAVKVNPNLIGLIVSFCQLIISIETSPSEDMV